MNSNYISEPVEFRQLEGNPVDFRKTFDLRGSGNDEALQLYLRRANLSDDIDRLPPVQRRTYVYDIVRSNKGPGYWVPPSMQVSNDVFAHPPPAVRPPPVRAANIQPDNISAASLSMSNSSSSNSLHSYSSVPPAAPVSSYSTNVVVSSKGSKYEISAPINFQHIAGDVVRDRTRNAFDLTASNNDNVLKKYMMEHGITDEDISGLRRQDVIQKIVHSNYTWLPSKQEKQCRAKTPPLVYATISTNNQITPPHSPPKAMPNAQQPQAFTNYTSLTSRFRDITDLDMPTAAVPQEPIGMVVPVQVQAQLSRPKIPPPPSAVRANSSYPAPVDVQHVRPSITPKTPTQTPAYATIATQRKAGTMRVAPPPPPKPTILPNSNASGTELFVPVSKPYEKAAPPPAPQPAPAVITKTAKMAPNIVKGNAPPPPPSPPAPAMLSAIPLAGGSGPPPPPPPPPAHAIPLAGGSGPPPPPPPPPLAVGAPLAAAQPMSIAKTSEPAKAAASSGDNRDAFLESIRQGVKLKKVDQKAATISGVKPRAERKPATTDFLSELKLGITLRRVKNPADNPYSDANTDESQA